MSEITNYFNVYINIYKITVFSSATQRIISRESLDITVATLLDIHMPSIPKTQAYLEMGVK